MCSIIDVKLGIPSFQHNRLEVIQLQQNILYIYLGLLKFK